MAFLESNMTDGYLVRGPGTRRGCPKRVMSTRGRDRKATLVGQITLPLRPIGIYNRGTYGTNCVLFPSR